MKNKYKTRKLRKQKGRGILGEGIKSKTRIGDRELLYKKTCPTGYSMCDQDEVNYGLCVPQGSEQLCSDPNYNFKYLPPDESDRNGLKPANRLTVEANGKGPIQDPAKPVKVFEIHYDGEYDDTNPDNPENILQSDVLINEETGRLKSYTPEFHPTSCTIQQKASSTIEGIYNVGDSYKRRVTDSPIRIESIVSVPSTFKILTQNALGLYWGVYGQTPKPNSANEAAYDLMRLRTALLRQFLKDNRPDFLCIQESTRTFIDLLDKDEITTMYPYIYPTEEEMIRQEGFGANATTSMMSKYPAKKATTYMLQGNSSYYNALGIYEFENLVIFNVYMQAGSEISPGQKYKWENYARCRRQQLMFIKQKIDEMRSGTSSEKAIVVLGDFNFELNSIRYRGEKSGRAERDANRHLVYDPTTSDMKWSEHKFLVGPNGLNLNDSYKELHIDDPSTDVKEGYTEFTDINTFRFLGKLEEKKLRYDGIFFNNELKPISSAVVNDKATILDSDPGTIRLFNSNGITDYQNNINKYNTEYAEYMIFNPKGNLSAQRKKEEFLDAYKTSKNKKLSVENGFELFVSDHFGVMTEFAFVSASDSKSVSDRASATGGKKKKRTNTRRKISISKRKTRKY